MASPFTPLPLTSAVTRPLQFQIAEPSRGALLQSGPPSVTPELRQRAINQMKTDTLRSAVTFAGISTGLGYGLFPKYPTAAEAISKNLTGFDLQPIPGSTRARPVIGKAAILGIAPAPVGYVPPEFFGLRPDFLIADELRKPKEEQRTIGVTLISTLGGNPGGARTQLADALLADENARAARARAASVNVTTLQAAVTRPAGLLPFDAPRVFRPEEIRQIAVAELLRRGETVPQFGPITTTTPTGTQLVVVQPGVVGLNPITPAMDPLNPKTVNAKAIANGKAAEGINRELMAERADP